MRRTDMADEKRERIPVTPMILLISGIAVGIVGLVMLILGIGGTSPTTVQVPGMNVNVSTSSLALAVIVLGFGVAVASVAMLAAFMKAQVAEKRKVVLKLAEMRPDLPADDIAKLANETITSRWYWKMWDRR
jgi:hypothetical protein